MTLNLPHDKALHIIVGVLVYAIFHFINPMAGMTIVVIAAVGKEVYDYLHQDKHTPEVWDAIATIGGGFLGIICGA